MKAAWRFIRRLRLTVFVRGLGEHHIGVGYHWAVGAPGRWAKGGENGLAMLDLWIAHREWDDPENDPRQSLVVQGEEHEVDPSAGGA
jgi:hypothetical protein